MRKISLTDLRQKMNATTIKEATPFILTIENVPICYVTGDPESVIVIEDLHPMMRRKLRALEQQARLAMGNMNYKTLGR